MDVKLWASCAGIVVDTLSEKWPKHQAAFAENGRQLDVRLQKLDAEIRAKTAALPEASRVLVSTHDAFAYYGKTYGFRVVAVQGISTVTEAGLADVTRVIDTIRELKVPAVFVESSVPRAVMERVSKDAGVKIGAELFADALGNPGEMMLGFDVGTYPGMMLYNSSAIVAALATKP